MIKQVAVEKFIQKEAFHGLTLIIIIINPLTVEFKFFFKGKKWASKSVEKVFQFKSEHWEHQVQDKN